MNISASTLPVSAAPMFLIHILGAIAEESVGLIELAIQLCKLLMGIALLLGFWIALMLTVAILIYMLVSLFSMGH